MSSKSLVTIPGTIGGAFRLQFPSRFESGVFQAKGVVVWENPRLHSWCQIRWIHYDKKKVKSENGFFSVTAIVSLRNRTAGRRGRQNARVWQTWQGYYLRVLSWSKVQFKMPTYPFPKPTLIIPLLRTKSKMLGLVRGRWVGNFLEYCAHRC